MQKPRPLSLVLQLLFLLLQLLLLLMVTEPVVEAIGLLISFIFPPLIWVVPALYLAALTAFIFSLIGTPRKIKGTAILVFLVHSGIAFLMWYCLVGILVGRS